MSRSTRGTVRPSSSPSRRSTRPGAGTVGLVVGSLLALTACGGAADDGDATPAPSSSSTTTGSPSTSATTAPTATAPTATAPTTPPAPAPARITEVPQQQWDAMVAAGMVRPECPVQERAQLRRVEVNFVDFAGATQRGHLVVRDDTAETTLRIFERIYALGFPIQRMEGVEAFDGDVAASLAANNTSAYNCRRADQINAPFADSPHANGRAVDVNPVQNPWMDLRCDCWTPGPENHERTPGPGKVLEGEPVWQAFVDEGWIWQNIDVPDYMHFDTGYPSRPYAAR
ncbi:M15 family metallopeptidase [Nocardioides sp. ChNu-153]|uniref:M15 family metallopeptidase n=1 Tax=unclassified Nocardioides TaxID=2615069 RepID=UPI00240695B9|nr:MULTISPECIES: M15 family metallopeptidase [unclassified Nocardioides]MDF9714605.1 M15 family metallopeptidase [Nocardioides sp. ChNu-99]MDN7119861.1 M15 family metallopeptidase [Nocardioides sp. ChNu-153]